MAKKTIVKEAVAAVRTVAGAALDAAAEEARRVLTRTVTGTKPHGGARTARPAAKNAARRKTPRRKAPARKKRR